jgi:hypothetical protein
MAHIDDEGDTDWRIFCPASLIPDDLNNIKKALKPIKIRRGWRIEIT